MAVFTFVALIGIAVATQNAEAVSVCLPGVGAAIGIDTPYGNVTIPHNGQDVLVAGRQLPARSIWDRSRKEVWNANLR